MFYVRERESLRYCPDGVLGPDRALALRPPGELGYLRAERAEGYFFREDAERTTVPENNDGDPAALRGTGLDYLGLAGLYEHVVTNRLHFAVAAPIMGRRATLCPNSYHKNRAVYDCWLKDLGCE